MSEIQTESPEVEDTAQEPQDGPQEPEKVEDGQQDEETDQEPQEPRGKAAREAAKYRVRAKEAEGQVQTLTEQVQTLQRQIVETHLDGLEPAAFWKLNGDQLDGLLDEDGRVNPTAVASSVSDLRATYGLARPSGPVIKDSGKQPEDNRGPRGLADAFSPDMRMA